MANTVGGLRSVQSSRPTYKNARAARPLVNTKGGGQGESLRPVATPVSRYQAPPAAPQDQRLAQLADALAQLNPSLARYGVQRQEALMREQEMKLPAYIEQIKRDYGTGKITAAQVGEIFPEMVPTLRYRVAQAIGEEWGKERMNQVVEEILANENLRLNTEARKAYIERRRAELFSELGGDNEFYTAGAITAFDKALAAHELNWQRETAAYHTEVMKRQWQNEVVERFDKDGPEGLLALDAEWKVSGGLNNETRNALLVETIAQLAYERDDPSILDRIPTRFLNRESKAKIAEYKARIENTRWSLYTRAVQMENQAREQEIRDKKTEVLQRFFNGEQIKPGEYRHLPEVEDYVNQILTRPRVTPVESEANARRIRTRILEAASTGDLSHLGITGDLFNEEALITLIQENPNLNPKDAVDLINEIPKLLEGISLLRDDDVRQQLNDRLRPHLDQLRASLPATLERVLGGRSLYGEAMKFFQDDLRRSFLAYYEEKGTWPKGFEKRDLIEAAISRTEDHIYRMQQPEYLRELQQKRQQRQSQEDQQEFRRRR
jgi:hypothetical protein